MATYNAIITYKEIVQVTADSEEQAIEKVKAGIQPNTIADVVIAQDANIVEEN